MMPHETIDRPPAQPCSICTGPRFWLRDNGAWFCAFCYPPLDDRPVYKIEGYDAPPYPRLVLHREAYVKAALDLAEALAWPRLELSPGRVVAEGEIFWRPYLRFAGLPELKDVVLLRLRQLLESFVGPDAA